jgi:pyruvate carboxylase subunit B
MRYLVRIGDQTFSISDIDRDRGMARIDGRLVNFDFKHHRGSLYSLVIDGKVFSAHLENKNGIEEIYCGANVFHAEIEDERAALLRQLSRSDTRTTTAFELKAPMPGLVVHLSVRKGQTVKKGQSLIVIEAMKMENDIKSPAEGRVATIHVKERDTVEKDALLLTFTTGV